MLWPSIFLFCLGGEASCGLYPFPSCIEEPAHMASQGLLKPTKHRSIWIYFKAAVVLPAIGSTLPEVLVERLPQFEEPPSWGPNITSQLTWRIRQREVKLLRRPKACRAGDGSTISIGTRSPPHLESSFHSTNWTRPGASTSARPPPAVRELLMATAKPPSIGFGVKTQCQ